jgi:MFS family permease
MLVVARALQGMFGALLAPAALSLLTTTFTLPHERGKAFGIFGAIAGAGGAFGLLIGGLLTEYLSWRWCMYVNLIFAAIAGGGGATLLRSHRRGARPPLDLPGTLTACGGLVAIVYGFSEAQRRGWSSPVTLGLLAAGVALLAAFVLIERRVAHPLLPLRVVVDRGRGGAYLACGLCSIGIFGVFLFLAFYMQQILGYSPVLNGVAFLPLSAAVMVTATQAPLRIVPRFGARWTVAIGMVVLAIGMLLFTRLGLHVGYAGTLLPPLVVIGLGMGLVFGPSMTLSTLGVDAHDAGVASAMVNTSQQVGGSIGTALLSTIATSATAGYLTGHHPTSASALAVAHVAALASIHGYKTAYVVTAGIFLVAAAVCGVVLPAGRPSLVESLDGEVAPVAVHV